MRKIVLAFAVLGLFLLGGGRALSWENEQQPPKDFVTGGGFIFCTPSGARGNFGVGGGVKNGAFWGHLNYLDHGIGLHVKGTSVTNYFDPTPRSNTRDICGEADTNLLGHVCYHVRVTDNGEPGKTDEFGIRLTDCGDRELYRAGMCDLGASGSGTPAGGNIQLHKGNKSNTGPASGTCGA